MMGRIKGYNGIWSVVEYSFQILLTFEEWFLYQLIFFISFLEIFELTLRMLVFLPLEHHSIGPKIYKTRYKCRDMGANFQHTQFWKSKQTDY